MKHPLPDSALDDRLAFVGTSGSGKTYAAGTAVERLLTLGQKVVVVDPLGVWYGLRVLVDGQTPGFPVVIFGGAHADLPLTEHAGGLIGETVASMAESGIISLTDLGSKAAERRFMLAFLERLYRSASGEPTHLIFDEADLWAPQKSSEPQLQNLMEQIVRRGRVKGFIPWLITQRPAVLSKDVLSQADGLVAMKLTSSQDRDALGGWIEGQADRADEKRMLARLPQLARGQALIWIPGRQILEEATFPKKKTFDSSSTPKRGEVRRQATLKPIDIGKLKARLSALSAPKEPAKRTSAAPVAPRVDDRAIKEAEDRGRRHGFADGQRAGYADGYKAAAREAQLAIAKLKPAEPALTVLVPKRERPDPEEPVIVAKTGNDFLAIGAERRPLAVLAGAMPAKLTESQWATLAGLKRTSGTWSTYKSRLRTAGLIATDGKLWWATPLGITAAGSTAPRARTPLERIAMWARAVGPASKLLNILVAAHPEALSRSDLAARADLTPSSGTFSTYLSKLSGNGLVTKSGDKIRASDDLFLEIDQLQRAT